MFSSQALGPRGERAAARFLRRKGYKIVARSVRFPFGELDLVAVDGQTVVFVEVKTRQSEDRGHPVEAVGPAKQRRMIRAAVSYLKAHRLMDYPCRFDVVTVVWPRSAWWPKVEHFVAAFDATPFGRLFA